MAGLGIPLLIVAGLWSLCWLFGLPYIGLVVALSGVIGWQYSQQLLLVRWIRNEMKGTPPDLAKPLDEVVSGLARQKRRARKRKRKVQALIQRFHELAKAMPDAAMVVDAQGRLLNFNLAARHLLGLDPVMDDGTRIDHLIRGESFTRFWHGDKAQHSVTIRLPGDLPVYVELVRVPLSQGNLLLLARDVTNLTLLNQKRKAFIDNASHELKTPLTVISGYLEVMADSAALPPSLHLPVREMRSHAQRMQVLITDMLQLASMEQARVALKESDVAVGALFARLQWAAKQRFPDGVGVVFPEDVPWSLRIDEQMLFSALNNLLSNALLHAHSRHSIELDAQVDDVHVVLSVRDDGIGMAAEHLPRITERFYRIDGQRDQAAGSGLGLSIARHAVEAHGGRLEIDSVLGRGSMFRVVLPKSRLIVG